MSCILQKLPESNTIEPSKHNSKHLNTTLITTVTRPYATSTDTRQLLCFCVVEDTKTNCPKTEKGKEGEVLSVECRGTYSTYIQ